MHEALDIHVIGIVQGVGFRPFVYRKEEKKKK
jgi:hydrogenase maturation factor HypF (carbamoyltransferase family)